MFQQNSRISGFYKKTHKQRLNKLKEFSQLKNKDIYALKNSNVLHFASANRMVENVISTIPMPLGIATNFIINKKNYLIPMATEESSVIAATSYAAKLARPSGGFCTKNSPPIMIGQIQLKNIKNIRLTKQKIQKYKQELLALANKQDPILISVGGKAFDLKCKEIKTNRGHMLSIHLLINVQDAMGANIANTMTEAIAPQIEKITGGKIGVKIVSNLATYRIVKAKSIWYKEVISSQVIEDILDVYAFAQADHFRCATHNKGIMNGIDGIAIATGNDFRAIEAGAHSFAALNQSYKPLTHYYKNNDGHLVGIIKLPLAVGIVGGITQSHPIAKICLKILGVKTSSELARVMAAVGLAQNFAALRALVCEGIRKGHMRLHSRNIAINAGVPKSLVDTIAQKMIEEENISLLNAKNLLQKKQVKNL